MQSWLLDADVDQLYVSVFRGWHHLEHELGSGIEPIDMDLADPSFAAARFRDRTSAATALQALLIRIPDDQQVLRQHVWAALSVLSLLSGALAPGTEYIERTVHLPCTAIGTKSIAQSRLAVEAALTALGREPDLAHLPAEPNLPQALREAFSKTESVIQVLRKELNLERESLNYNVSQVTSSGYWKSWVSGSVSDGLSIRFNVTPRRPYFVGDALSLSLHEIAGHALQMMQRRALIASKRLAEAYGITGVFGPEQFHFEGLAETMPDSLARLGILEPRPDLSLARHYEQLRVFIYHNAHCMLLSGKGFDDATVYVLDNLPAEPSAVAAQELQDRVSDPFLSAYLFVYGLSDYEFSTRIAAASCQQVARELYSWYTVPSTWLDWPIQKSNDSLVAQTQ
jgi:hypothetical protein